MGRYIVILTGHADSVVLDMPRDLVEQYLINRAVGCGYTPIWRQVYPSGIVEYGIEYDGKYHGRVEIIPVKTITSLEDEQGKWTNYPEKRQLWDTLLERGQTADYVEYSKEEGGQS